MYILFSISMFLIAFVLWINLPEKRKTKETTFKVDLGNGIEFVSLRRLNNLTEGEKDYLFKNAKKCSSLQKIPDDLDTSKAIKITDFMGDYNSL